VPFAPVRAASVTARAPAKVNLQLSVGSRRGDGYHDLATVFHAVSVYDEVTARPGAGVTLLVDGTDGVPRSPDNLAYKAAVALAQHAGIPADVELHLRKEIPVAAGMAGGSADAAAALVACDAVWGLGLSRSDLLEIAGMLGSDVPFALVGGTAVGLGRGEQVTPALTRGTFHWVFAVANRGLSTPAVYAEFDRLRSGREIPPPEVSEDVMSALLSGDASALGRALSNDLQPAACNLRQPLRLTLDVGEECGALGAIVSGSGPTCAFLVRDADHGLDLAVGLSAAGVVRSVLRATGPVAGARVIAAE
jgi:4-diphosphocytidyl-2-C-methyl-D-erythritol kinase